MFKHLLITTDGSPASNKAAKAGIALARALGAKVTAYCALSELEPIDLGGYAFDRETIDGFEEGARRVGQERVDAIAKMARAAGVSCASVVPRPHPPESRQRCDG